jgi:hypothetical protein
LWATTVHGTGEASGFPQEYCSPEFEHYRRLLATETDPAKRGTIEKLLAEEEAKLRALEAQRKCS